MGNDLAIPKSPNQTNYHQDYETLRIRGCANRHKSHNDLRIDTKGRTTSQNGRNIFRDDSMVPHSTNNNHSKNNNNNQKEKPDDYYSSLHVNPRHNVHRSSLVASQHPSLMRLKNSNVPAASASNPKMSRHISKKISLHHASVDLKDSIVLQQIQEAPAQQQANLAALTVPVEDVQQLHIYFKRNPKSNTFTTLKWKHIPYRLRNLIVDLEDSLFLTRREVESLKIYYLNVERDEKIQVKHDLDLVCIRQLCRKFHMVQMFVEVDQPRSASFSNLIGMTQNGVPNVKDSGIKYRKIREIGRGAFGVVSLIIDQRGIPIAEKKIRIANGGHIKQCKLQKIENEINLLESLDHAHIVQYYGTRRDENYLYILLEYVPCGSIGDLLKKMHKFDEELISAYLRQTLIGLQYLHSKGVIHRDIKPDNLLLTSLGEVKLADFGCSTIVEMQKKLTSSNLSTSPPSPSLEEGVDPPSPTARHNEIFGTPAFLAPEVIAKNEYTFACDIWAVGCMGVMLYNGEVPWSTLCKDRGFVTAEQLMIHIGQGHVPPFPTGISPFFEDFLNCCLQLDPEKRSTVAALLKHKFISGDCFLTRRASIYDRKLSVDSEDDDDENSEASDVSSYATYISTSADPNSVSVDSSVETREASLDLTLSLPEIDSRSKPATPVHFDFEYHQPSVQEVLFSVEGFQEARIERDFEFLDKWSVRCDKSRYIPLSLDVTIHHYPLREIIADNLQKYLQFVTHVQNIKQVTKVYCIIRTDTELLLVQEAVDYNWSEFLLYRKGVEQLNEKPAWYYLMPDIGKSMVQLHEKNYILLFLVLRDVMYDKSSKCFKLKNIGVDKYLFAHTFFMNNMQMHNYAAPEVIKMDPHTIKSDIWLIGYHLLQLVTGKTFSLEFFLDETVLNNLIMAEIQPESFQKILISLLKVNPDERMTIEELRSLGPSANQ
jgi:serine/threonine protein kinase